MCVPQYIDSQRLEYLGYIYDFVSQVNLTDNIFEVFFWQTMIIRSEFETPLLFREHTFVYCRVQFHTVCNRKVERIAHATLRLSFERITRQTSRCALNWGKSYLRNNFGALLLKEMHKTSFWPSPFMIRIYLEENSHQYGLNW